MPLGPTEVIDAARLLLKCRGDFRQIRGFPPECRPADMDDAYLISKAFAEEWELPIAGYKIGATAKDQQAKIGVTEPFYGRVFAPFMRESPAELAGNAFHMRGLESEFAVRMKSNLKPREKPYTVEDVQKAVGQLYPAIEVVDSRLHDWIAHGPPSIVADNAANGALVLGKAIRKWRDVNLARAKVSLTIDGEKVGEGTGKLVMGHPMKALAWLANKLSAAGVTLERDQIVTTGTMTGLNPAPVGSTGIADFGELGQVQITFTA